MLKITILLLLHPLVTNCYCGLQVAEESVIVSCNDLESFHQCERAYSQYEDFFYNLAEINHQLDKTTLHPSKCAQHILCVDYDFATHKFNSWGKYVYLCGNMDSIEECSEISKKVDMLFSDSSLNKTNVTKPILACGSTKISSTNNLKIYKYSVGDRFMEDNDVLGISQIMSILPLFFILII